MIMTELKSNRLACYIVALIVCFVFFMSTIHSTNYQIASPVIETINNKSDIRQQQQAQLSYTTYDPNWIPKEYSSPSQDTLQSIMDNIILHQEQIITKTNNPTTNEKTTTTTSSRKNILLTAVVNSGMIDYTLNWIESLRRTNLDRKFLVFGIDQGVVDILVEKGYGNQVTLIPDDWFHVPLTSDFALWKSNDYRPITHAKTLIVERLLYLNITVWFSDVDIVILNPFILDTMLIQMADNNIHMIFSQEVDQRTINSGFYMIKPSLMTKQFMARMIEEQDKPNNTLTQQKIMNRVLKSMFPPPLSRDILMKSSPYRLLDMLLFPNGKYYFRMGLPKKLGLEPMMVHANYLIGDKKKDSLIKAGLWYS